MDRIRWVEFKGKRILIEDFSKLGPGKELTDVLSVAHKTICSEPIGSVKCVVDASDAHFILEDYQTMENFVASNTPYIKIAALVEMNGFMKIAAKDISKNTGRSFHLFNSREEALEYLAENYA